ERPPVEWLDEDHQQARVIARLPVEELAELFGVTIEAEDVETVGGLLAQRLGRVPVPGAVVEVAGLRLRAEGGNDRRGRLRITTVTARRVSAQPDPQTCRPQSYRTQTYRTQVHPAAADPPQEASDTRA
ncbi:MAG TPA: transporter associated domain-containing protein, partial [Pseudonocardiaceae bacterium]|nr:transporter associated domain-containing protein [Pseudonocardiaceae bacterium]